MLKIYNTDLETNRCEEVDEFKKGAWVNLVNPSEEEISIVCDNLHIDDSFIRYPLDYEEQARIDIDDDKVLFVIDIPIIENKSGNKEYSTMPMGLIVVRDEFIITVSLKKNRIIDALEKGKIKSFYTYKKTRFILQVLYLNSAIFLEDLKKINRESENTVALLEKTMKNKEIIQLMNVEKSLVYFTTSLKSNEVVMEKTTRGKVLKLYEEDEEILEDAIVENRQAIEMGKIYSDILNGTMDTYASIISNNLNVVMKFLTSVTIVLSIPTLIASIWGMNVKLPFMTDTHGFLIVTGIAVATSVIAFWLLKKRDMI